MEYQLGLIGYPIKHSLSPWIHQQFLEKTNINGKYHIDEFVPEQFENRLLQWKEAEKYHGYNVTAPYKQRIVPFLDELDETARNIGAVNTVVNQNGKIVGYNTDGIGYQRSLEKHFPEIKDNKSINILIIGAGGAARAIYYTLNQAGFHLIDIANRTLSKAEDIANLRTRESKTNLITLLQAEENLSNYDLVIQTTNVGMMPESNHSPIKLGNLKKEAIVSDIVYQPIRTNFIRDAQAIGARIHLGHSMLLFQAQFAFELWTGKSPSTEGMDEKLKKLLEG